VLEDVGCVVADALERLGDEVHVEVSSREHGAQRGVELASFAITPTSRWRGLLIRPASASIARCMSLISISWRVTSGANNSSGNPHRSGTRG
jgi:hypothetical protein